MDVDGACVFQSDKLFVWIKEGTQLAVVAFVSPGIVADSLHGGSGVSAGGGGTACLEPPPQRRLLLAAEPFPVCRHHVQGTSAAARHLCGQSHLAHRRADAHVRQQLLAGPFCRLPSELVDSLTLHDLLLTEPDLTELNLT